MNAAARLGLYGAGLAVVFGGAYVAADAVVPQDTVDRWTQESSTGHQTHAASQESEGHVPGVTSAESGYLISPVTAPDRAGVPGTLSFEIRGPGGEPVTGFTTTHEKKLHLIVVRTDGNHFRHVHPTMAADGTWSIPWEWEAAGTHRIYADFVPEDGPALTLTRSVDVAGNVAPRRHAANSTATVGGYTVDLGGELTAGGSSELTFTVSRDGRPVTTLEPYLGASGHLVALREGDLAYLHVHPEGESSGPDIDFVAEAPTAGHYLLYLDFKIDGQVHTASFGVDTEGSPAPEEGGHSDDHSH